MTAPSPKEALELKPCPFCNTAPAFGRMIEPDHVTIGCNNDGCLVQLCIVSDSERDAVKAWNTRATLQPSGERREAIARLLVEDDSDEADDECELCGGRGTVDAYTARTAGERGEGRDEIGCPACIKRGHSRIVREAIRSARDGGCFMRLTEAQERALETLDVFDKRRLLYDTVNQSIKDLNPDFPSLITMIDEKIETSIVNVLDSILGAEIASYYLNECRFMKDGGYIIEDGKKWPIRTVDDVRAYVTGRAALAQSVEKK